MAKVVFPASELLGGLRALSQLVDKRRGELLEILGVRLLSESQKAFQAKSRGGQGSDGIKWKSLAASTIERKGRRGKRNEKRKKTAGGKARPGAGSSQIGVDTGLMRASGQPGAKGSLVPNGEQSVTVGYSMEYATYFDEIRPLMPDKMPAAWQNALDDSAQRFINKYVEGVFR